MKCSRTRSGGLIRFELRINHFEVRKRNEKIKGSTERPTRDGVVAEVTTERSPATLNWENEKRARSELVQDVSKGATERPETVSDAKNECREIEGSIERPIEEVETLSIRSKQYEGALETITEDASGARSSQFSAVIGQVSTGQERTEAQKAEEDEERTKGKDSTQHYERLFTDEELDMLEHGGNQVVTNEPEEYEKELVERRRGSATSQAELDEQGKPTLAEMSAELGIPEDVLEQYWLDWYAHTLETSTEAKRANRDFKDVGRTKVKSTTVVGSVTMDEDKPKGSTEMSEDALENELIQNVCVGLEEDVVSITELPAEETGTLPFRWRSLIRTRVYELLKQEQNVTKNHQFDVPESEGDGKAEDDIPLLRDKENLASLDEDSLREYLVEVGGTLTETFKNRVLA
ncbi:hypothetical protein PInf_014482 [Phytophthora infestans]|nr:hypothetical protein PInf_014482 [Phytophthora infestans]